MNYDKNDDTSESSNDDISSQYSDDSDEENVENSILNAISTIENIFNSVTCLLLEEPLNDVVGKIDKIPCHNTNLMLCNFESM